MACTALPPDCICAALGLPQPATAETGITVSNALERHPGGGSIESVADASAPNHAETTLGLEFYESLDYHGWTQPIDIVPPLTEFDAPENLFDGFFDFLAILDEEDDLPEVSSQISGDAGSDEGTSREPAVRETSPLTLEASSLPTSPVITKLMEVRRTRSEPNLAILVTTGSSGQGGRSDAMQSVSAGLGSGPGKGSYPSSLFVEEAHDGRYPERSLEPGPTDRTSRSTGVVSPLADDRENHPRPSPGWTPISNTRREEARAAIRNPALSLSASAIRERRSAELTETVTIFADSAEQTTTTQTSRPLLSGQSRKRKHSHENLPLLQESSGSREEDVTIHLGKVTVYCDTDGDRQTVQECVWKRRKQSWCNEDNEEIQPESWADTEGFGLECEIRTSSNSFALGLPVVLDWRCGQPYCVGELLDEGCRVDATVLKAMLKNPLARQFQGVRLGPSIGKHR